MKYLFPKIRIIGVEPEDADAMYHSLQAGKRVTLDRVGIFADGVAVRRVGEEPFRLAREYVDEVITVSTDEICAAIQDIFEDNRTIVEPAGALAVAGIKRYVAREQCRDRTLRRDQLRREHELRPAAPRRRARRHRRPARSADRGGDPGAEGQLPALLRDARPAQRHRVQLPLQRRRGRAAVRRPGACREGRKEKEARACSRCARRAIPSST